MTASRTVCNPLDLPYAYSHLRSLTGKKSLSREAADPSIVLFQGTYFLFASMTPGFFHSDDLVTWQLRRSDKFPAYDYAPDVREVDGALIISASRRGKPSPFYRSTDPLADDFVEISPGTFPFWDPNLFQDDDGRLYLYWGCDARVPIQGVELDKSTYQPIGIPEALISSDTANRGWERNGENHDPKQNSLLSKVLFGGRPFIEGAWMTKHNGTYYLQYAAPATELNTYADGYYTGPSPLGPFRYAPASPFSSKPGGFLNGAGHGSTFSDMNGNWWHTSTMRVSVNQTYERRIGVFPAGFDRDGTLFCNQNFADYPMIIPDGPFDPWTDTFAGWMLQSFRKPVTASSAHPDHPAALAVNESARDWWVAATNDPGESLTVDLGATPTVHAVQVNVADHQLHKIASVPRASLHPLEGHKRLIDSVDHPTEYVLEASLDGESWTTLWDGRGTGIDAPHKTVVLQQGTPFRYVRVTGHTMPFNAPFALSGLRVFGIGTGNTPATVTDPFTTRTDPLTAAVSWAHRPGATGYNLRYGRHPDKLYQSWLVYDQTSVQLGTLNAGEAYWVAVDAFNENGITPGTVTAISPQIDPSRTP